MDFGMEVCSKEGCRKAGRTWQASIHVPNGSHCRRPPGTRLQSPGPGTTASDRALQHLPSVAQEEAIWPRETDLDSVWSHLGISPPLKASPDQPFHLYLQGNATHLCSQEERGTSERVVTWVSGCASRRHSPGNGTLEPDLAPPHLARVGGRGELNQAPSLGVARHLRDISGVERPEAGEAGSRCGSSVCLRLWSGIAAWPGLFLLDLSRSSVAAGAFQSCSPACSLQMPLVSMEGTQLSFGLIKNQNGSRRQGPLKVY